MDFSKFNLTPSAKQALLSCQDVSQGFGHLKIIDLHLFFAILEQDNINVDAALRFSEIVKDGLKNAIFSALLTYKEPRRKKEIYSPEIG